MSGRASPEDDGKALALAPRVGIAFATGSSAMSLLAISTSYVLLFMTTELGIAASTAGLYLAAAKIYDALTDSFMGVVSDRTKTRWGRRRPYFLIGSVMAGLAYVLLFMPPRALYGPTLHLYMIFALLFYSSAYTVFRVPHWALSAEITKGYHERTHLMAYVSVASLVTAAAGGAAFPYMLEYFAVPSDSRAAFSSVALIMGLAVFLVGLLCFILTGRIEIHPQEPPSKLPVFRQFRSAFRTKPFVTLLTSHGIFLLGVSMLNGTGIFFIDFVLDVPRSYLGNIFVIQIGATLISQPFWVKAVSLWGKRNAYVIGVIAFSAGNLSWLFATADESWLLIIPRVLMIGAGGAGIAMAALAMLPDTMEYDKLVSGSSRQGLLAGVYTTMEKMAQALGVAFLGFFLDFMNFQESKQGDVAQPSSAIFAIQLSFVVLPVVFAVLSMLALYRYTLDENSLISARLKPAPIDDAA